MALISAFGYVRICVLYVMLEFPIYPIWDKWLLLAISLNMCRRKFPMTVKLNKKTTIEK